ncbi:MAG: UDP-N-acetylmuramoyl-tripeptide--D-alanyl-D-alanine ligase [Bryobacteraceae bacterium]|nr:UDP-N-acetylmuramoyl-tripeptide--D-alanyl-D-alanine ligase [Bryobacteraceae bacterium]MDW8379360.1 UDP-N-acetylmuramoyl-tripeptide--D-alanyl-D-alanine ligase [Bryobacterales bacterium]
MQFTMRETAAAMGALYSGPDGRIQGWSIDSRTMTAGDLFFALRGPYHDGHAFVAQAIAKGAAGAVVDHIPEAVEVSSLMIVNDVLQALQRLSAWARTQWGGPVVGVTGSAGKTTTKEIIAALLSTSLRVGKSAGNLNNHLGVPLSLLRLPADSQVAVIEIGMNHRGEITELAALARPQIGVVTNVGYAHIENFDSVEGIAAAKRELIEALPAGGIAVLNADDVRVRAFATVHPGRTITFGLSDRADVRAEQVQYASDGCEFVCGGVRFRTKLAGRHGVLNLLAGLAVAQIYGLAFERLVETAALIEPGSMRGQRIHRNGIEHINDCYNSNPDAARAMVDLLVDTPASRRIAVLGEMLELGRWSEPLHRELGRYVAASGIHLLVGIRGAARQLVEAAVEAGLPARAAQFFEDPEQAGQWLKSLAQPGDVILWKGSRGTRVELALEKFLS